MYKTSEYFSDIQSIIPFAHDIRKPNVRGSLGSVFIVDSIGGSFVCKFNHHDMAIKNSTVSHSFANKGIPTPNISAIKVKNHWVEIYPLIPGKTLYEHIHAGMPGSKVKDTYLSIVNYFAKMDSISPNILTDMRIKRTHQVARINISDTNNAIFGHLFSQAVKNMNNYDERHIGVYHCGLTPKNVILDDKGNLSGFVDMDEVAIADRNYAFGMMAAKYKQFGYNPMDLVSYYEEISGNVLNRKKIKTITDLTNFGKSLLWHCAIHKKSR